MTENIVKAIVAKFGVCLEVESNLNGRCWGTFTKARIRLNIFDLLKRRVKVRPGLAAEFIWVNIKYE